ncbi:hypothetical protein F7725_013304 [Dissostichus mawsoni]|uniref:Uncharacterized protein n=1 Tax=Dissostichus mawsoni TaxID=36200 RepID=A0A7J5YPP6_DISMA|nr:hypothetical protein F7725_013304 [Dissostichus mawsoni]
MATLVKPHPQLLPHHQKTPNPRVHAVGQAKQQQRSFPQSAGLDGKGKDRKEEVKDDDKCLSHEFSDSKKGDGPPQSQLQLAMSQTQTALAQSLYYGQYSRGLYMDQKMLLASKCCDQTHSAKQRGERGQG